MPCRYHPDATVEGECADCKADYCLECEIAIVRHGRVCLDCGAAFARRKLRTAYILAGVGFLFGIFATLVSLEQGSLAFALLVPMIYAYLFSAVFFGYHYGGKIWIKLANLGESMDSTGGAIAGIVLLGVRLAVALILGVFGGGIVQYLRYRRIVEHRESLSGLELQAVEAGP